MDGAGFLEDAWLDRTLAVGSTVQLTITGRAERCVMTTFAQSELPKDSDVFRAITQHNALCFGVYATVLTPGTVCLGDEARLLDV